MRRRGPALAALALLAGAVFAVRTVVLPAPLIGPSHSDFASYHAAARHLVAGRSPYEATGFLYPPLAAFLVAPLGFLDYVAARRAWYVLSLASLLLALTLLRRILGGRGEAWTAVLAIAAGVGGLSANLVLGQVQPLLLALLAGAVLLDLRGREVRAALLVGVAAAVKVWPAGLLVVWAARRRLGPLLAGAATTALLVIAPLLALRALPGPQRPHGLGFAFGSPSLLNLSATGLVERILTWPGPGRPLPETWWRLGGMLEGIHLPAAVAAAGVLTSAAILGCGAVLLLRSGISRRAAPPHLAWAGALALGLAALPVSWPHYQLLHWLTLTLLLAAGTPRGPFLAAAAAVLLSSWAPVLAVGPYVARFGWTSEAPVLLWLAGCAGPLGTLGLLAAVAAATRAVVRAGTAEGAAEAPPPCRGHGRDQGR